MKRQLPALALALAALWSLSQGWIRDLWCDEALTMLQFVPLDYAGIYTNYTIPNNHIGYSWLLKLWSNWNFGLEADYFGRLGSMLPALAAVMILYFRHWRRLGGRWAAAVLLGCFSLSLPFALYGTALRGYMLSFFLTVLALEAALAAVKNGGWKPWAAYMATALAAVAVIPSNLIALAGVVLFAAPETGAGWSFLQRKSFWGLSVIPVAALMAFYAPIAPAVAKAMELKEGWANGWWSLAALYLGFAVALLPILCLSWRGWRRQRNWIRALAFLLPVLPALLLTAAPFPRTYFPLWAVWLLVIGMVWRAALVKLKRKPRYALLLLGALLSVAWALGQRQAQTAETLSRWAGGARWTASQDDWFAPYYRRDSYAIRPAAAFLADTERATTPVYLSFDADAFALLYYGPEARYILWNTPERTLRTGTLVVLAADEAERMLPELRERFRLRALPALMWENGFHRIYQVR